MMVSTRPQSAPQGTCSKLAELLRKKNPCTPAMPAKQQLASKRRLPVHEASCRPPQRSQRSRKPRSEARRKSDALNCTGAKQCSKASKSYRAPVLLSAMLAGGARACTRAVAEPLAYPGAGSAMQKLAKCFWTTVALSASSHRATGSGRRAAAMLQARRRSSEGALFALPLAKSVTERAGGRDKWRSAD